MAYKDPDYDPKKAHEYYEKHKKLKGRKKSTSTKGFTQTNKEQLAYAQAQLRQQQTEKNQKARENAADVQQKNLESIARAKKQKQKQLIANTKTQIDGLRERYKNASPEQKEAMKEQISAAIFNIQEKTKAKLAGISDKANKDSTKAKATAKKDVKTATATNKKEYEDAVEEAKKKIKSGK